MTRQSAPASASVNVRAELHPWYLELCLVRAFRHFFRSFGALFPVLVLSWTVTALGQFENADARAAARAFANDAANAFARGDYARAHELCRRAYALVPAPTIALLDARSLVGLRRYLEAGAAYDRALRAELASDAPEPFQRAVHEAAIERAALVPRIPRLKIVPPPEQSVRTLSIALDERILAKAELGTWLSADPGAHRVQVTLEGKPVLERALSLTEGDARVVFVEFPVRGHDTLRSWGYVGFGAGAAGAIVGVLAGSTAVSAHDEAEKNCPNDACVSGSRGADALDRFRKYRTISTVGYAVGAAAVTFGAIAVFWPRTETTLSVAARGDGVWLEGEL